MELTMRTIFSVAFSILVSTVGSLGAADLAPSFSADDFDRLQKLIKPQPGESHWRDIPWLTSITEARAVAVREDKPLVIFTAADGSPLGRT